MQEGKVKDIQHKLQDMERVQVAMHGEIHKNIVDLKNRQQMQCSTINERNENQFTQLKEILNEIQVELEVLGRGNNDPKA